MTRGNALRYLGWQVRDRTGPRVLVSWFIAGGVLLLIRAAVRSADRLPPPDALAQIVATTHQQISVIAAMILAHAVVSHDRTQGYFRFYLSKPVSPVWYYGQHAVLAFAGALAATAGFVVMGALLLDAPFAWHLLGDMAALFALFGMLTILFSTLFRHDWILAALVLLMASVARSRWPADKSDMGRVIRAVMPPNHLIGESLTAAQWAWVGGWGVGLFLLTLLILRLRPLGED